MAGRASIGAKCIVSSLVIYAQITLVWTLYCAVLLCNVEFRWKITLLFVYMLNLWLHMQNPHYRSYRAGTRNMMLTFDSRPIYRALTYIAVPFIGPQQPRYIGLTLYLRFHVYEYLDINGNDTTVRFCDRTKLPFYLPEVRHFLGYGHYKYWPNTYNNFSVII